MKSMIAPNDFYERVAQYIKEKYHHVDFDAYDAEKYLKEEVFINGETYEDGCFDGIDATIFWIGSEDRDLCDYIIAYDKYELDANNEPDNYETIGFQMR